jgi:hypothetical protein
MSGQNTAGYAVFSADGGALAYETVPTADAGCGSTTFPMTLHVLDIGTGVVRAAPLPGLHEKAWPAGGAIYGDVDSGTTSAVVRIDPATLTLRQLVSGPSGTRLVGLS